jgi:hypothetical protein
MQKLKLRRKKLAEIRLQSSTQMEKLNQEKAMKRILVQQQLQKH